MVASRYPGGVKLGLGGHSYIAQLGNDPPASFGKQCALVADAWMLAFACSTPPTIRNGSRSGGSCSSWDVETRRR